MRIAVMGTPGFAVPTLEAVLAAGHEVAAVYTQPPRPAHRGKRLAPSPMQQRAEALGLPLRTPASLRPPEAQAEFAALDLDAAVVAAYGLILPPPILAAPRLGCLNVHGSLLPRWRGAAPVQRAILAGDEETGVCIMDMEAGLDTGPVRARAATPIGSRSAGELTAELAGIGARLMVAVLADPAAHPPVAQPAEGVTYARKIDKAEARIDWSRPAEQVARQLAAFDPAPGAWFALGEERIRAFRGAVEPGSGTPGVLLDDRLLVACGTGAIRLTEVQRAGRPRMKATDLLRGLPLPPGTQLA